MGIPLSTSVWSRPRWPVWLVAGGMGLGLVLAFNLMRVTWPVHPLIAVALFGVMLTFGMSCTALAMMVGALIAGLAGNRDPLGESRAPRAVVAIATLPVALLLAGSMIAVGAFSAGSVLVVAATLAAAAFALIGWSRPWPTWVALLMLSMVFVTVEVARETGHLGVAKVETRTQTDTEQKVSHSCQTSGNWDGPREFRAFAHDAEVYLDLDGNIGALLRSPASDADQRLPSRVAAIEVRGTVDAPLFGCWLPLYKRVTVDAQLEITGRVSAYDGAATARCRAKGTLDVHLVHRVWGIQSCYQLRHQLAEKLRQTIHKSATGMID